MNRVSPDTPVIAWWSGGVTSAVTCRICADWFGIENVRFVFIDTHNEDTDTYRFKGECERWYGKQIETITHPDYTSIQEVWYRHLSLNVATGAKCSQVLKRSVRERFERENRFSYQAFGFDIDELKRARGHLANNPKSFPIFPLIANLLSKKDCVQIINDANSLFNPLTLPRTYHIGYLNNNCFQTGCIQGGIGYWQKIQREDIEKFNRMAKIEHELTDLKGQPVTILKDQGKDGGLVFLLPHPGYPTIKDISMMKGRDPKPLMECYGFCGSNDLERNETAEELNFPTP